MEYHVETLLKGGLFMDIFDSRCAGIMEKYNFRRVDAEVLFYLCNNQEKNTASDIGRFLNRNKGYISQVVDRLCTAEYITAVTDRADRRYVHYLVCPKSLQVAQDMQEVWNTIGEDLFAGLTDDEKKEFFRISGKLRENMVRLKG